MSIIQLRDLDVFYLSYDEPNCDVNWDRIQTLHKSAKRIHGVPGFDKAHRACALASTTRRFVVIDGDNWLNDNWVTDNPVIDDTGLEDACFSYKGKNTINGLEYGNGGVKVWDRETFLSSATHERSDSTDFCWDIRYYQINDRLSTSVQNCTPYQAWRSGYREGVKMTQIKGKPCANFAENWKTLFSYNLSRLHVWCSVGRDVQHGVWAILGARQAVLALMQQTIEHTVINDYKWFDDQWKITLGVKPEMVAADIKRTLSEDFDFYIPELNKIQSEWFKQVYINPPRTGLMI